MQAKIDDSIDMKATTGACKVNMAGENSLCAKPSGQCEYVDNFNPRRRDIMMAGGSDVPDDLIMPTMRASSTDAPSPECRLHYRLELAGLVQLANNIAAADELAVDKNLRNRRPVAVALHPRCAVRDR